MKLELKPFDFAQAAARAGLRTDGQPLGRLGGAAALDSGGTESLAPANFRAAMAQALGSVSATQFETQDMQRELQMDNPTVSLEQTMISMQKSQIGFQAVVQVRNRLVQAYSDIMNMQV